MWDKPGKREGEICTGILWRRKKHRRAEEKERGFEGVIRYECGFPGCSLVKKKICLPMQDMWVWFLGREDPLKNRMTTHSSILAWRIPWTEEPGGLQSIYCNESDANEHTLTQEINERIMGDKSKCTGTKARGMMGGEGEMLSRNWGISFYGWKVWVIWRDGICYAYNRGAVLWRIQLHIVVNCWSWKHSGE